MIKLMIDEKSFSLPTNFGEIYLKDYQEVMDIVKDNNLVATEKMIWIISTLTKIPTDVVYNIDIEQIKLINNSLQFIFNKESTHGKLVDFFKIDGVVYGIDNELSTMKLSQYIDLDNFSKQEDIDKNLHILMAILYRPVVRSYSKKFNYVDFFKALIKRNKLYYKVEDYDANEVKERAEIFKEKMNMDIVLSAVLFFSLLRMASSLIINGCSAETLELEMMKLLRQHQINI